MNLIILQESELNSAGEVVLNDARAGHVRNVLKARKGQTLRVGILNGPLGFGEVIQISNDSVALQCHFSEKVPERPRVDLLLAMPRPKVMKRLWPQLAALGVGRVIITNAEKVERFYFDTHVLEPDFYNKLLISGLQQAGDTCLPEVSIRKQLKPLLEDELDALCAVDLRIIGQPGVAESIENQVDPGNIPRVLLAIGPEGGWTDYELSLFKQHNFCSVGFGNRILRSDTACIALLTLTHYALTH